MNSRARSFPKDIIARMLCGLLLLAAAGGLCFGCAGQDRRNPAQANEILVRFSYFSNEASSICIAGDFNGWSKSSDCMRKTGETWSAALPLPPGRYQYAFIIDGLTWRKDPAALLSTANGFGEENSVLIVY